MAELFKKFMKGILYVLVLPVVLVVLALFAVIGLFQFIIVGVKALFLFFTGRNIFGDLPEDIEAKNKLYGSINNNTESVEVIDKEEEPYITSPFENDSPSIDIANNDQLPPLPDNHAEVENIEPVSFEEENNINESPSSIENNNEDKGDEL